MAEIVIAVTVGSIGIAVSVFLYLRSQIPAIIAVQSLDATMIGGDDPALPDEVMVLYRKEPVTKLTLSTVWLWNAGKKTVRRGDILSKTPLELAFSGDVLKCRTIRQSRSVVEIEGSVSEDNKGRVSCTFQFLDPGDGGVLEIHHTGSAEPPSPHGTLIGLRGSPKYWGRAWGAYASSTQLDNKVRKVMNSVVMVLGLGMTVSGALGPRLAAAVPFLDGFLPSDWLLIPLGLMYAGLPAYLFWTRRRRFPSALVLDATQSRPGRANSILSISVDRP